MKIIEIGKEEAFTITWLNQTGETSSVTGTPTITIKEYDPSGNSWSTLVSAQDMTLEADSTYYYEYDTSSLVATKSYIAEYLAVIDTLSVRSVEDFSVIATTAKETDIDKLMDGNTRYDFVIATAVDTVRKVNIGMLDNMTIITKGDSASDWSSPTSTKTVYFWYDAVGNCIARREDA